MQFPIVQQYKTDIAGINPDNQILDEPSHVEPGEWTRVIVPLHAPFFVDSLVMKHPNGAPLIYDKDFRIFRLMTRLTELCAKPVACMIELIDLTITDVLMDYKVVGEFSLIDNGILQLITAAVHDDRPIWWDNLQGKALAFPPTLHSHSLIQDIVAWQDVIECMDLFLAMHVANGKEPVQIRVDHYYDLLTNYIAVYGEMLSTFLTNHQSSYNAHGLTAAQIGKDLIDNFATATSNNVLQGRKDMHLTPACLETIIETYGFNSAEYLPVSLLPISSFINPSFSIVSVGWVLSLPITTTAVFRGKPYTFPANSIDLHTVDSSPGNKTFYIYATLVNGVPAYSISTQKQLETVFQIWVGTIITNATQILNVTYFNNVFLLNGHRISEIKMGNSIPVSSGLVNTEGLCPWLPHVGPTAPTVTVPATVHSNAIGNILTATGSTATNGIAVTYSISQSGTAGLTFSKTAGIVAGAQVTFSSPSVTADTVVPISVFAVDSTGGVSTPTTVYVTILKHVAPTAPTTLTVPSSVSQNSTGNILTVSGSVPSDNTTLTYSLTQTSGPTITFSKVIGIAAGEQVTFTTPSISVDSIVVISATAVDSTGLSSPALTASTTIRHHVAPTAPTTITVASSVYQRSTGNPLTTSGAVATDGATITYSLTQSGGTAVTFSKTTGIAANEVVTFTAPSVSADTGIVITVKATDSMGLVSPVKNTNVTITAFPTQAGTPYGGGYYIGNFTTGGHTYALIDAGKSGDQMGPLSTASWGNDGSDGSEQPWYTFSPPFPVTDNDNGLPNTQVIYAEDVPDPSLAVVHCLNWRGGGFADWYLPSIDEQGVLYRVLAPGITTVAAYKPGGGQTLQSNWYWNSSLANPGTISATGQIVNFVDNSKTQTDYTNPYYFCRPMRRVQIS